MFYIVLCLTDFCRRFQLFVRKNGSNRVHPEGFKWLSSSLVSKYAIYWESFEETYIHFVKDGYY